MNRYNLRLEKYNNRKLAFYITDSNSKNVVIFCHGFRGSSIGPNRFFVTASDLLIEKNISSVRFDQYGSGNSEGAFFDSSFEYWVDTTKQIVKTWQSKGYKVALLGQSMGASAAIVAASEIDDLTSLVCWSPDPSIELFKAPNTGYIEEAGQRVQATFWKEAHDAAIDKKLRSVKAPTYIVQCSEDEYVSPENHQAILNNAQKNHVTDMFQGYKHSKWSYIQSQLIINKSVDFIASCFK